MSYTTETDVLAPLEIWEVMLDDYTTIKFREPLVLTPSWMPDDPDEPDDNEYLEVDCPELAISSYGVDHEELACAIRSDIRFAWRHFVQADDHQLTRDAKTIKDHYLSIAEEIDA